MALWMLKRLALFLLFSLPFSAAAETYLYMAEEAGCVWCARWDREIADAYPKTPEGIAAPLRKFDLHGAAPDGVEFGTRVRFTPTFVLVRDGLEVDRIEGYPGEDFFWGLLGRMLSRAEIEFEVKG